MDNVLIVVDDLDAVISFFVELGMGRAIAVALGIIRLPVMSRAALADQNRLFMETIGRPLALSTEPRHGHQQELAFLT